VIVPSVVEEKAVESDAAALVKLPAEPLDDGESRRLVKRREVAEVVPGVVVKKGPVRVSRSRSTYCRNRAAI
jgi:hypothetical protein